METRKEFEVLKVTDLKLTDTDVVLYTDLTVIAKFRYWHDADTFMKVYDNFGYSVYATNGEIEIEYPAK